MCLHKLTESVILPHINVHNILLVHSIHQTETGHPLNKLCLKYNSKYSSNARLAALCFCHFTILTLCSRISSVLRLKLL